MPLVAPAASLPRGVKNNNPGNIRSGDPWQGLAPVQSDPAFCQFLTNAWGFRAMAVLLCTFQDRYGLNTITKIISRWAPPGDNNDTPAYIEAVCKATFFSADEPLNLHDYNDAFKVIRAIAEHEQGGFDQYFKKVDIDIGCIKAGLENAPRGVFASVAKVTGTAVAAGAAAAASDPAVMVSTYNTVKPIVDVAPHVIQLGFWGVVVAVVAAMGIGEIIRVKNRKG